MSVKFETNEETIEFLNMIQHKLWYTNPHLDIVLESSTFTRLYARGCPYFIGNLPSTTPLYFNNMKVWDVEDFNRCKKD